MKKSIFPVTIFIMLLTFVGCTGENAVDIDSFLLSFSETSGVQINKSEIDGFYENGKICHCFTFGDILVSLTSDENTMKIISADAVTEKENGDEYKNTVRLILSSLTVLSDDEISGAVSSLISPNGTFSRGTMHLGEYSLSFIELDSGCKFTVKFDRFIAPETTKTPETQCEFDEYDTIPETKE